MREFFGLAFLVALFMGVVWLYEKFMALSVAWQILIGAALATVIVAGVRRAIVNARTQRELEAAARVRQAARDREIASADGMSGTQFEYLVARLLRRDGFGDVEVSGRAGDLGADVIAAHPDGRRVVVQCKRYAVTNRVRSKEVQAFNGTAWSHHGADIALFVTTSQFTADAERFALRQGIRPIDRQRLAGWMAEGAIVGLGRDVAPAPPPVSTPPTASPAREAAPSNTAIGDEDELAPNLMTLFEHATYVVDRADVESGDLDPVLGFLRTCVDTDERTRRSRGSVLLNFAGYDTESRELWEIPEVCDFVHRLDACFPYWLHVLDSQVQGVWDVLVFCLTGATSQEPGRVRLRKGAVGSLLMERWGPALSEVAGSGGWSEPEISGVLEAFVGRYELSPEDLGPDAEAEEGIADDGTTKVDPTGAPDTQAEGVERDHGDTFDEDDGHAFEEIWYDSGHAVRIAEGALYPSWAGPVPEKAGFRVNGRALELVHFIRDVSPRGVAVHHDLCELAVIDEAPHLLVVSYRLGASPWSDAPYEAHRDPDLDRRVLDPDSELRFRLLLVDADTGVVVVHRLGTVDSNVAATFRRSVLAQLDAPYDDISAQACLDWLYSLHETPEEMVDERAASRGEVLFRDEQGARSAQPVQTRRMGELRAETRAAPPPDDDNAATAAAPPRRRVSGSPDFVAASTLAEALPSIPFASALILARLVLHDGGSPKRVGSKPGCVGRADVKSLVAAGLAELVGSSQVTPRASVRSTRDLRPDADGWSATATVNGADEKVQWDVAATELGERAIHDALARHAEAR